MSTGTVIALLQSVPYCFGRGRRFSAAEGNNCKRVDSESGERVFYLKADSAGLAKFETQWEPGVFLNTRDDTGEILVGKDKAMIKARGVKMRSRDQGQDK